MNIPRLTYPLLLLLAIMLASGGCNQNAATQPVEAAAGTGVATITWAFWGGPAEIETHKRVAEAFMAEHPHLKLELMAEPWSSYFFRVKTLWAGGDPAAVPDVLLLQTVPEYAAEGELENLDPYIAASGHALSDYWPALLESVRYEGRLYGLPRQLQVEVLYYNRELFDAAGLAYPTDSWTWDDLRTAAEALTHVEASERIAHYGLGVAGSKYQLWLGQTGGSILDDMRRPARCTLTEPAALAGLSFLAELMNDHYAMRDAALSQAGGAAAVFRDGRVAMLIHDASLLTGFNQAGLDYDVAPLPLPAGGRRLANAGGPAWAISALSDDKAAAWEFLNWLQSPAGGQKLYSEAGTFFPARPSAASSTAFLTADAPPANRRAFLIEAEKAQAGRFGYFPEWAELEGAIIIPGLQRIWSGEATIEETVPKICAEVDAFLVGMRE